MISNEKGWALPLVILVMVVLTVLGSALFLMSMTSIKHATIEESKMQAYYLARSGAELVANHLDQIVDDWDGDYTIPHDLPYKESAWVSTEQNFEGGEWVAFFMIKLYKESIPDDPTKYVTVIESTGIVNDITETLVIEVDGNTKYWKKQ